MIKDDPTKTPQERVQGFANALQTALQKRHSDAVVSVQNSGFELTATLMATGLSDTYTFDLQGNFIRHWNGAA